MQKLRLKKKGDITGAGNVLTSSVPRIKRLSLASDATPPTNLYIIPSRSLRYSECFLTVHISFLGVLVVAFFDYFFHVIIIAVEFYRTPEASLD